MSAACIRDAADSRMEPGVLLAGRALGDCCKEAEGEKVPFGA